MALVVIRYISSRSLFWLGVGLLVLCPPAAADIISLDVLTPDFSIVADGDSQRIVMEGYGERQAPGKPILPCKRFLIALPPGARTLSVNVEGNGATPVSGCFRIEAAPPIIPVSGTDHFSDLRQQIQQQWQAVYETIYSANDACPGIRGRLVGAGSLRRYAYAAVSFYPFDYYPESGELIYFPSARITVEYEVSAPVKGGVDRTQGTVADMRSESRAQRLFTNFAQVEHLYGTDTIERRHKQPTYDYVIITTSGLTSAIEASGFPAWKTSLGFDVKTVLVSDSEIAEQPGSDLARKIRNFLRNQYGSWGIEFVLIVGDLNSVPMRYCYPDPDNHTNLAGIPSASAGEVPTDFYYADLSLPDIDSWDLDGDGYYGEWGDDLPDLLAEVYVGRIPTSSPGRITYTLEKLIAHEQDSGAWKTQALQAGAFAWFENEDFSGREMKDLATYLSLIEDDLMAGWNITHFSEQAGLVPSSYPWTPLNTSTFAAAWRNGRYGIVNWGGHGWPNGVWGKYWAWDDGDGVPESSNPAEITQYQFLGTSYVLEDDYPSIVFTLSCLVGYPEANSVGNYGIDLLTDPSTGPAVGIICGTRVVWVSQGGGELHCYEFNRHLIDGPDGPGMVGPALYDSEFFVTHNYSWDHFAEYWDVFTYNLYGDPSLVWQGVDTSEEIDPEDGLPTALRLFQNYPNPFNPGTSICFELADPEAVTVRIFDVAGRQVRVVQHAVELPVGRHEIAWNARDDLGRLVSSGTYFCRVEIPGAVKTGMMLVVR